MSTTPPLAVVFDLDNTLAVSKQAITSEMAGLLSKLLARSSVAVISGGSLTQLKEQVASQLPPETECSHLYLLPTSGAALYAFTGGTWVAQFQEMLTEDEIEKITQALTRGAEQTGLIDFSHPGYGPYIENRGSQVSLSVLGQLAPVEAKQAWDPTHEKREKLRHAIAPLLPEFDVKVGGSTTIDVTKRGINKAYGVEGLAAHLGVSISEMIYIGDELRAGGNDEAVLATGICSHAVEGPAETTKYIEKLLAQG